MSMECFTMECSDSDYDSDYDRDISQRGRKGHMYKSALDTITDQDEEG